MFRIGDSGIYRQGDVLLIRVKELPKRGLKEAPLDNNRIVLAYGEVTGHAHAIALPAPVAGVEKGKELAVPKKTAVLWDAGAERFLQVLEKTSLRHEEHAPIPIEPGIYKVVRQREYDPEQNRMVAD
jgi:hypothetical protein